MKMHVVIDPTYDRHWIAQQVGLWAYTDELDEQGRWTFHTNDPDHATAVIEDYPTAYLAKRLPEARQMIEARALTEFLGGFSPTDGPLSGHTLQCRDMEDRTNWLASQIAYATATSMGHGAVANAVFRTAANATVTLTYAQGAEVLLGMQMWGSAIMRRAWQLKDAAAAAATIGELDAVLAELNSGWPSTASVEG